MRRRARDLERQLADVPTGQAGNVISMPVRCSLAVCNKRIAKGDVVVRHAQPGGRTLRFHKECYPQFLGSPSSVVFGPPDEGFPA